MGVDNDSYWNVAYLWGFGMPRVPNCRHVCKLISVVDRVCWENCWNGYCRGACTNKLVYRRWKSSVGHYAPTMHRK